MPIIDADAHVIETERTWAFMEPSEEEFRPVSVPVDDGGRESWSIGDRRFARRVFETGRTGTTIEMQELADIDARLRHMDALGVDVHVLYPTLFLRPITEDPRLEAALYKSYNRWLGETWEHAKRRLRWAILAPTLTIDLAVRELAWAKEHVGCAVFMRFGEAGRILSDPYFDPLYAAAVGLDLPICIHAGNGSFAIEGMHGAPTAIASRVKFPALSAVHEIILSDLPTRFPALRFGVIETSASWVPYFCHDISLRFARRAGHRDAGDNGKDILRAHRVYVACQTNDDLDYILRYAGEDNLVIGSDYGHDDTSAELEALRRFKTAGTLPSRVVDKILNDNARALYGL
jgi:predicted TIM-barrel fold metal-dependent hydrolase